jgi:polyisoprenoid-binding protein YceI
MQLPRRLSLLAAGALAATATGCGGFADAQLVAAAPDKVAPRGAVETYQLTPSQVQVEASVSAGPSQTLRFGKTTGTLRLAPGSPEATTLELVVALTSATAAFDTVADIAKTRFLHVTRYPEARVVSRSMRRAEEGLLLYADFDLHGTTKTIAVPVTIAIDACRARVECEFTFRRSDFGVVDEGNLESLVSDDIDLKAVIDVPRTGAPRTCPATPPS